ncbi:MAG TPA: Na+/H+ antiporter NhaA [Sphingomicrobium sp.]|nr:Na+/H+ antiporter NhaA [Sphingomicrobium sp.]
MATEVSTARLDPPVDSDRDHLLGTPDAPITLVEYGSYACPHCRAAHNRVIDLRDQLGDRLAHVFRHRPLPGNDLARRAAELAESAAEQGKFWKAHVALMTRSDELQESDLEEIRRELDLPPPSSAPAKRARQRVRADEKSAKASGVLVTPAFFINGRRYDGPWDDVSFADALFGALGYRVRAAALDFVNWTPSSGLLLLFAAILAVLLSNSGLGPALANFWQTEAGVIWEGGGFTLPLIRWVNDGLLTIFFLVVGLEIKREFTVGHLANRRLAAMPVAASLGGMFVPAATYLLFVPAGPWTNGWGVPIGTDTAFAVALIAAMGQRVPIELRIFLTAAAIVDDIGAILVIAFFYSDGLQFGYLAAALPILVLLGALNRAAIYRVTPYAILGLVLWVLVHQGGVHATVAGVLLALFIPTRPPPDYQALMVQADAIVASEVQRSDFEMRHTLSNRSLQAIEAIHDRLESPAARLLRHVEIRSSYVVLPIFAFANAGVAFVPGLLDGKGGLVTAISAGLLIGKPLGLAGASYAAVRMGIARKPEAYSWTQVVGAGCLAGIGFTMSLFIAGEAFPVAADFNAAKIAIFATSAIAAILGVAILWWAGRERRANQTSASTGTISTSR